MDVRKNFFMERAVRPRNVPKTEQFSCSNKEAPRETQRADMGGIATKMKITQAIVRKIFPETAP